MSQRTDLLHRAAARPRRRGTSLVETLIAVVLVLMIVFVVYQLLRSGVTRGDEMTEDVKLMVGVRAVMENMARDVAAAHVVLVPTDASGGKVDFKSNLALARYASEDASGRIQANSQNPVYPFFDVGGNAGAAVKLDCLRVRYLFDPKARTVTRIEEKGALTGKMSGADQTVISEYSFAPEGDAQSRPVATDVTGFEMTYVGYDRKGQPELVKDENKLHQAACVALVFHAAHDTGVYARNPGEQATRRLPRVDMATKFWVARRVSDVVYPEYTSSADEDLRY